MLICSYDDPSSKKPCNALAIGYSSYGEPICIRCQLVYRVFIAKIITAPTLTGCLTFQQFSQANKKRCESPAPNGFGESIEDDSAYDVEHWALAVGEEAGEVLGAVLGMTGRKARKKHLTKENVFKEIGDTAACLDLLAQRLGSTLGECMLQKFNEVSDRIGSDIKL
jgi:NTP pyrophosphatase (non-canonical NTP hydrolase)